MITIQKDLEAEINHLVTEITNLKIKYADSLEKDEIFEVRKKIRMMIKEMSIKLEQLELHLS